ncbi:MAG TPA: SEC-C domain-containing protein [Candidatus Pelethomonas intestinigallinarum]|nr:SEC-C domain-containing protein [Candidatus Pelethomonas intestinigallinarum]
MRRSSVPPGAGPRRKAGFTPAAQVKSQRGPRRARPLGIGRNDPCPCGSGKKYKHCCGR